MNFRRVIIFSVCAIFTLCSMFLWVALASDGAILETSQCSTVGTHLYLFAIWPVGNWILDGNSPDTYWLLLLGIKSLILGLLGEVIFITGKRLWPLDQFHVINISGQSKQLEIQTPLQRSIVFAWLACFVSCFPIVESGITSDLNFLIPVSVSFFILHISRVKPGLLWPLRMLYLLLISTSIFVSIVILFCLVVFILMLLNRNW